MAGKAPSTILVYQPDVLEGQDKLARLAANVHAGAIGQRLQSLCCPQQQKLALLDAVIVALTAEREQTP